MGNKTLPAINQRVDIWFDGYDEFYGGRVDSVSAPYRFHVILDDRSAWDIDVRKHVYRLSTNIPDDDGSDSAPDDQAADDTAAPGGEDEHDADSAPVDGGGKTDVEMGDAERDAETPTGKRSSSGDGVDRDPTIAVARKARNINIDMADDDTPSATLRVKEPSSARPLSTPAVEFAEADPHAPSRPLLDDNADDNDRLPDSAPPVGRHTRSRDSGTATPAAAAAAAEDSRPQQRRRMSGRALRKNANSGPSRPAEPALTTTASTQERPRRAAAIAAAQQQQQQLTGLTSGSAGGGGADSGNDASRNTPTRAERAARRAAVVAEEASQSQSQTTNDARVGARRGRGGSGGMGGGSSAWENAGAAASGRGDTSGPATGSGVVGAKRRRCEVDTGTARPAGAGTTDAQAGATTASVDRRVRAGARGGLAARMEMDRREEEAGVEKLTTKTITAIAVDAALETAKAVMKPVNERLNLLLKQLEVVTKELGTLKAGEAQRDGRLEVGRGKGGVGRGKDGGDGGGSGGGGGHRVGAKEAAAALESFEVDVSEVIGGGEARIKAYSKLSQNEFEALHRVIAQQGAALKELDRLLYAARSFADKGKATGLEMDAVGADEGEAPSAPKKT